MVLTNTRQWGDKGLKIEREKEKAGVFREGLNLGLMIAKGEGGVPNEKWDDPSKKKGPFVPPPKKASLNNNMMIAGGPSFDIGPGHGAAKKKAKGFNKTRNNPNDSEVKMIKKMLGGPELPDLQASATSQQIRNRLKPFTKGLRDYDLEGGGFIDNIPPSLKKQLLRDAKA